MAASSAVPLLVLLGASLLVGYGAKLLYARTRVSEIAVLLVAGLVAGPLLGLVDAAALAPALAALAPLGLVVVLFEGGLELAWREVRAHGLRALRVGAATWAASAVAVAALAHLALGLPLAAAVLLGLALAATGILVVIPLLASVRAPGEARVILTLETALGDLLSVVLVTAVASAVALGVPATEGARLLAFKFAVGASLGVLAGVAWARVLHHLSGERNTFALTLGALTLSFALAEALDGSGFLAALAFGLVVGNARSLSEEGGLGPLATFPASARANQSEVIFILKSFYFLALGASVRADAFTVSVLAGGIALVACLAAVRVLAVNVAMGRRRAGEPRRLRTLVAGVMPRGLATALIAGIPVALGIPGTEQFLVYTFIVILGADLVTTAGVLLYARHGLLGGAPQPAGATEAPH